MKPKINMQLTKAEFKMILMSVLNSRSNSKAIYDLEEKLKQIWKEMHPDA